MRGLLPITDDSIYNTSKYRGKGCYGDSVEGCAKAWMKGVNNEDIPAEAFPNRTTIEECIGLPPTFIHTMEHDPCIVDGNIMDCIKYDLTRVWLEESEKD